MTTQRRVDQQPAFILHHRPFRDSSRILDIVSRDYGKLALVARGSRAAKSRLKGLLRPFQPLSLSWYIRSDLGTLTGAEIAGEPLRLDGDALLSGYYVNELVLHFLHRHDAQPEIFETYAATIGRLRAGEDLQTVLRTFEIELLRLLGYALTFEHEAASHDPLDPQRYYDYRVEQGPVPVDRREGPLVFRGDILAAIGGRRFDDPDVRRAAGRLLREVIRHHLGGRELRSRKVLLDVHRARMPKDQNPSHDSREQS